MVAPPGTQDSEDIGQSERAANVAANGSAFDDGQFCGLADECQVGESDHSAAVLG